MEYYGWFYEKRVVTDLFAAFPEDLLPAVRGRLGQDKRIFENVLYYHFLRDHPEGTRYRFASVNVMLRRYLGAEEYAEYMRQFAGPLEQIGVFEYVSKAVTEQNLPALIRLFREEDFRFYRFELLNRNERLQQTLIDETPITFLVSSENYRRTRERVAVCLSGEARHYRQNVKFIRNFLAGSEVDVFFHFWESPDQHFIADALAPKAYLFEPRTAVPEPPPRARPEKFISPDRDRNVMSALYSMRRANGLKQAYEEEQGFRYDVVVRLRLDVFTTQTLMELLDRIRLEQGGWERTVYVPDMAHSIGINDQVVLGSSEAMDVFMSVIDEVESIAATELFNPEYFLLRHILRAGLRIRTVPFEYVLLRNADVSTFDLEDHVHRTRTTWWSAQLPEIPHRALNDFFGAKADSVLLIDELGLETPKTFRLRSASHGYLSLERASGRLAFTPHLVEASTFFLIIAGGEDRTAVDVRCRDLVLDEHGALRPEHDRANLYPDAQGTLLADGPSDPYSAFFLARAGEGVTLEWRAGFWRTPDESRREAPREPGGRTLRYHEGYRGGRRLFVHASASGLSLAVAEEGAEPFLVEYVADPAAEASRLGVQQSLNTTPADSDPLVLRLLWRSYVAARIVEQRGASGLMRQATQFMRRHAFLAARDNGTRGGGGGIVTRAMRFVRERL